MDNLLIITILVIFFILMMLNQYLKREYFKNYLFSTKKKLTDDCKKDGLKPAYMPTSCILDGKLKPFRNCKCIDNTGECKKCYDEIKKDDSKKSLLYDADEFTRKKGELNKRLEDYLKNNRDELCS